MTTAPRVSWCWWCKRAVRYDDDDAHWVTTAEGPALVCGSCYAKADPPVPLDYTEEED